MLATGKGKARAVERTIAGPVTQVDGSRFHFAYTVRPDLTKPASLLIVDGNQTDREGMKKLIEDDGYVGRADDKSLSFTAKGRREAEAISRRTRGSR